MSEALGRKLVRCGGCGAEQEVRIGVEDLSGMVKLLWELFDSPDSWALFFNTGTGRAVLLKREDKAKLQYGFLQIKGGGWEGKDGVIRVQAVPGEVVFGDESKQAGGEDGGAEGV